MSGDAGELSGEVGELSGDIGDRRNQPRVPFLQNLDSSTRQGLLPTA